MIIRRYIPFSEASLGEMRMTKKKLKAPFMLDDWSDESLTESWEIVKKLAVEKYGLSFYTPSFEVVNFEDMLHIYTGSLPIMYDHWSFGKSYVDLYNKYMADRMGVAYEVIFNTNPALCYLLEHNSPTMQGLVMAHAAVGHSAFFKNNVLFKEMTNAATIIPFLKNAVSFIKECEDTYGQENVERLLDACHALSLYAIDRMPNKEKTQKEKERIRIERAINRDAEYDKLLHEIPLNNSSKLKGTNRLREENILKFLGQHSPILKPWQRQIISIYCNIQQYLYPQMLTKLMNEGFASFWHHTLMSDLSDLGHINPGGTIEFLHSHCSVLRQPDFDERGYYGINPYKLGFEMFKDIRRICEHPTDEDRYWFPDLVGKDWVKEVKFAAYNFKDESFILQYLSPKLIRDFKLFTITDDEDEVFLSISNIHDDEGYSQIRRILSQQYNHFANIPDVYVEGWDARKSRTLYLTCKERNGVRLDGESNDNAAVCGYIKELWPFKIIFKVINSDGEAVIIEG